MSSKREIAKKAAVATAAVAGLSLYGATNAPYAAATDIPVFHWNIKGGCADAADPINRGNCGELPSAQLVALAITAAGANRPWTISLNEVCKPQWDYLKPILTDLGYSAYFSITNPGPQNISVKCQKHGNALFQLGTPLDGGTNYTYPWPYSQSSSTPDQRTLYCRRVNTFIGVRAGCVSHLNPGQTSIAFHQDEAAKNKMNALYPDIPRTLGVDRNMEGFPTYWTNDYKNIIPDGTKTNPVPTPLRQYDYIWGSTYGHAAVNNNGTVCDLTRPGTYNFSDHCIVRGNFVG